MSLYIIKRNGNLQQFDKEKIVLAIAKAAAGDEAPYYADAIARKIEMIAAEQEDKNLSVEDIQNLVEEALMDFDKETAREYIRYRYQREVRRSTTDKAILELMAGKNEYWNKENSNKDATVVTTQRDYLAGITSTDIARRFLLPPDVVQAHDAGIIHEHDTDYLAQNALHNCCLINLDDALQNGTVINGVAIHKPHKLLTAATIATQVITAVASSQYGGCTISLTHLAPFVRSSFAQHYKTGLDVFGITEEDVDDEIKNMLNNFDEYEIDNNKYKAYNEAAFRYANKMLNKEITDAVQTFNYQINSMSTTNGQAPFLSVDMDINENPKYRKEVVMLITEFLIQRIIGMPNEKGVLVTPAFPKLLYVLDENNITPDSEYWWLTELAAKCTAKRMVPDYISAKKMREYKISPIYGTGDVYPCMGCRSFLTPDRTTKNYAHALNYVPNQPKYYGRFNCGVTTINLADVALSSGGDFDRFWQLMEERTELCHQGLLARIMRLEKVTSDVAPILWQHGALARLEKGQTLYDLIHHGYSTASLGFAALYECVKYMTGHSHSDGAEGEKFGLEVMKFLNDKCQQWKKVEDIDYSVYGTPIESTTFKFAKNLKRRFGDDVFVKLDGHDRNYITNSYHLPVFEKIDAFNKLKIESKFQQLAPGGCFNMALNSHLEIA